MKGQLCEKLIFENLTLIDKNKKKDEDGREIDGRLKIVVKENQEKRTTEVKISFKEYGPCFTENEKLYADFNECTDTRSKDIVFINEYGRALYLTNKSIFHHRLINTSLDILNEYYIGINPDKKNKKNKKK